MKCCIMEKGQHVRGDIKHILLIQKYLHHNKRDTTGHQQVVSVNFIKLGDFKLFGFNMPYGLAKLANLCGYS